MSELDDRVPMTESTREADNLAERKLVKSSTVAGATASLTSDLQQVEYGLSSAASSQDNTGGQRPGGRSSSSSGDDDVIDAEFK